MPIAKCNSDVQFFTRLQAGMPNTHQKYFEHITLVQLKKLFTSTLLTETTKTAIAIACAKLANTLQGLHDHWLAP